MKVSISLSESDLAVLDRYAEATGLASRSAAVQVAIRQLRLADLDDDYAAAWDDWERSGEQAAWEVVVADAGDNASR